MNPNTPEICDGRDNDCDGGIDEDVGAIYYADLDGDGYGDGTSPINSCEVQAGLVSNTEDCNDDPDNNGAEQYPGRPEVCDNLDNNCNGQSDENVGSIFYTDADGDGFGDADLFTLGCEGQEGLVSNGEDCDDTNIDLNPCLLYTSDAADE